jgi:hypothetical protein
MAVAALLALGTLAVLAGGLSTAMNVAMANMLVQPKVSWGLCMAGAHFLFGAPIRWETAAGCLGLGLATSKILIDRAPDWWGIRALDVRIGQAVLRALRLAHYTRFAAAAAGPIGFLVLLG